MHSDVVEVRPCMDASGERRVSWDICYRPEAGVEDKPASGMWHCGPNAAWVTVTHVPTMISARAFDKSHHHARQAAQACCEMLVEQSRLLKCQFPERVRAREASQ